MGTKIEAAAVKVVSPSGNEYIPLGQTGWTESKAIKLDDLKTYMAALADKIFELNSSVEVDDSGTGAVIFTLDGTELFRVTDADGIVPTLDNTIDLGTATNQFKDLYVNTKAYLDSLELGVTTQTVTEIVTVLGAGTDAQLATAAAIDTAIGASSAARWFTWAGAARSGSDSVIATATHLAEGTPVRFKQTAGTWRYAIVDDLTANNHTILGHPCTTSDDDEFQYGNPELVFTEKFHIAGQFGGTTLAVDTTTGLLYTYLNMKLQYSWSKPTASIVGLKTSCYTQDTIADPTVGLSLDIGNTGAYVDVFSPTEIDVDNTEHNTAVTVATANYEINYGDVFDFDVTQGTDGDAADIDITLIFVIN